VGYSEDTDTWRSIMPYLWEKAVIKDYKKYQYDE
jgi:hypothetical protein